jgi:hypothetical protein
MIKFHYILLRMRKALDKRCRENQDTHFMFKTFYSKIAPFMSKNMVGAEKPHLTQHGACWINKATRSYTDRYKYLLFFQGKNVYVNALQYYVMPTLSVLF